MKKVLLYTILVLQLLCYHSFAQYNIPQNYKWAFGLGAGLDFTSGTPTAFATSIYTYEACASVCDASGNMLFYSDGVKVYDRTGAVMASGSAIVSYLTTSSTMGCLIVPVIGTTTQYYVFSLEQVEGGASPALHCRLSYSIVDMTLSSGMGDVVASSMGTAMTSYLSEKMLSVEGDNCNIWLLTHRKDSTVFLAYSITASGIGAPVVSNVGTFTGISTLGPYCLGQMKVSHSRDKVVTCTGTSGGTGMGRFVGAELYDFAPSSGVVSNCMVIDSADGVYGCEFSPNNTRLYLQLNTTSFGGTGIFQYDLTAGSAAAIRASLFRVGTTPYCGLRLGPDGKIYFPSSSTSLGSISAPNTLGAGCGYAAGVLSLASGTSFNFEFTNLYYAFTGGTADTTFRRHDTTTCVPTTGISITAPTMSAAVVHYYWDDGVTTRTHTGLGTGVHWVVWDTGGCHKEMDTFVITRVVGSPRSNVTSITACPSMAPVLLSSSISSTTYHWSGGSGGATYSAATAGTYWVWAIDSCGNTVSDTFHLSFSVVDTNIYSHDTSACAAAFPIRLSSVAGFSAYHWLGGATGISQNVFSAGTYWVWANDTCGGFRADTFHVRYSIPFTTSRVHDTAVCTFLFPITLTARPGFSTYYWSGGGGGLTHSVAGAGTYWVYSNDSCGDIYSDTFKVRSIIPDTTGGTGIHYSQCITTAPLTLSATGTFTSCTWSTGSTSPSINVSASGTYRLFKISGCSVVVDTFYVTFIPVPILNLGPDVAFCIGDSIVLSSTQPAGTTFTWSTGSSGDSIHVTTTGTYWLRLNNGCSITDSIHVLVSPHPVVDLGPDTFNCLGGSFTLQSAYAYSLPTYLWSDGSTGATDVVTLSNDYWLKVTVAGCATYDTVHVTIVYDTFRLFNGDTMICKGKVVQAVLNAYPGASFQWLPTAGIAIPTASSPLITPDTSATYSVTITIAGCPDKHASFHIDVQPNPDVYIGGNRFVCLYDTIHINADVKPGWYTGYTYSWSPATSLDFTNTPTVVFTAGLSQKYFLTVTTSAGCTGKDSAQLIVQAGDFGGVNQDFAVCPHDSVLLTGTGGTAYNWHPGTYLSDSNAATVWVKPIADITYNLVVTSNVGCHDTVSVHITVHPAALITLDDSVMLYPGETIHLNPVTNCNTFLWFPPAGLSSATISDPIADPQISTRYFIQGTTADGCQAVDSIDIVINPESLLALPNAFTPGTGTNSNFSIIRRGEATLNHFRIFDRWGQLVFETNNVNDGWDGTYKGAPQPLGVYVYDVQAVTKTGKVFNKAGNVTLLR